MALKVLDPAVARNPDAARRFIGEGQKAATLDHPAIVPVFAAGDLDGLMYLAMRLVPGCSLADELTTSGPLTDDRLVQVVTALAGALDHAHQRGIVHRDVKPANILVDGDRVWLTDFGIAATMQAAGRYTTGALGTAAYMAPEQIRPALGEIDGRADLYALGCVIYECVTGRPPYLADDLVALLYAQAQQAIPSTGRVAIDAFMLRALAKNAPDRFSSGEELLAGLREALAGHILAPRVRRIHRADRAASPSSRPEAQRPRLWTAWRRLAEVTVEGHRAETADDLARRAGCSSPVAILFGGVTGRFCQLNGKAWDGGGGSTIFNGYSANVKGQSWTVLVADGVPSAELFTFRDSFSFEGDA